jgi:methyltransferase-like protein
MMLQHVEGRDYPQAKTSQARPLLKFLAEANEGSNSMHAAFYQSETVAFDKQPDQYVYQEYLEAYNRAYYFKEFVSEAQKHSLQFLGESDLPSNWIGNLNEKAKSKLEKINDLVLRSHDMDCINNRTFRESLLVHSDTKIDLNISTDLLASARFSGSFKETEPSENPNPTAENKPKCFKLASGRVLTTSERSTQLVAELLDQVFPCSLPIAELHRQIEDRLEKQSIPSKIELKQLAASMIQWSLSGWIQFRFLDDRMKSNGFHKPKTTTWARSQTRAVDLVTNQAHNVVRISGEDRLVLPMLDGTRDMDSLANEMELLVRSGAINLIFTDQNKNLKGKELHRHAARQMVERLAANSFLLPDLN